MVLLYKLKYNSNNNTLKNFLFKISKNSELEFSITTKSDYVKLYVEGSQEELMTFSDELSSNLPMSIFLLTENVEAVESMPENEFKEINKDDAVLPFCPTCLKAVDDEKSKDYYNPFMHCELCGQEVEDKTLLLTIEDEKSESTNYKELFEKTATLLKDGKKIKIKTFSGEFVFGALHEDLCENIQNNLKLFITDINTIGKFVIAQKSEVIALASIEKPSIDFKQNVIFKSKNLIQKDDVNVRICNDFLLYLLSRELIKLGIESLYYVDANKTSFDASLTFNTSEDLQKVSIPKVVALQSGKLLPVENYNFDKNLSVMYSKFEDSDKSHFMTILQENSLFETKTLNLYCSKLNDDKFSFYSEDIGGFNDLISFKVTCSMKEVFNEIKKDETGGKLINSYKTKFPELYDSIKDLKFVDLKDNIFSLWTIASLVLGFDKNIQTSGNKLIQNAISFTPEKGPRIDYYKQDKEKVLDNKFAFVRLIKSGMSFKLAGVDDNTISFGYIESFSHFVAREVENANEELRFEAVSLSGSLFGTSLVTSLVEKELEKNFKLYYNKDFPIEAFVPSSRAGLSC